MHSECSASNGAETFVQPNPTPQFPGASHKRSTRMIKMFVHLDEPKRKIKGGSSSRKVVAKDMGQNRMIRVQIVSLGKTSESVQVNDSDGGDAGSRKPQAGR